ncbi:MAG: site-2 protease family protein [Dehalococcoidales bacterium]|nr:MAG: site-2 protease family protein [Dehalococcoidales bacterium]
MDALISILTFLAIIIVLILAHEIGHLVTAKSTGVTVEEFGLFYPPRLVSIMWRGTRYSINTIPLGGFCKMAGEEDPDVPGSLASKNTAVKLLVLASGSLMNFLLPIILFSIAYMIPHNEITEGSVKILEVSEGSPAAIAGILPGDTVISVDGKNVVSRNDVSRYIQMNLGTDMEMTVLHENGVTETVSLVPRWKPPEGEGSAGILPVTENAVIDEVSYPFWEAIPKGFNSSFETFVLFKNGILGMITGAVPFQVAGPVGIAQVTGEIARAGMSPLLEFAAFLSMNLAIVNLFPLPALDGGRIAFVLLQWIRRGKRISPKTEGWVHVIGFVLLMIFFLAITFQDILRIIRGDSLLP